MLILALMTLLPLLGATLRHYRQQFGLTHKALAARTGLTPTYIGEIERGRRNLSVLTGADAGFPDDTLLYSTDVVFHDRIRYTQIAFVEYQKADGASAQLLGDDLQFVAAPAGETDWAVEQRSHGKVVRFWDFDDEDGIDGPPVNFPATNVPFEPSTDDPLKQWYMDYLTSLDAAE